MVHSPQGGRRVHVGRGAVGRPGGRTRHCSRRGRDPGMTGASVKPGPVMSRIDFTELITAEGARLGELHAAVHRTFRHRSRDARSRREWEQACEVFHSYVSPLHRYLERACTVERYTDKNLLEFAVCFMEVDPWFFRSGYFKESLLTRLKRSDLEESTRRRLRTVLLDSVDRRGMRDFKYYCRLAAVIADQDLVSALEAVAGERAGSSSARRAGWMLQRIRQKAEGRVANA